MSQQFSYLSEIGSIHHSISALQRFIVQFFLSWREIAISLVDTFHARLQPLPLLADEGHRWEGLSGDSAGVANRRRGGGRIEAGRQPLGRSLIADGGIHRVGGRPYAKKVWYQRTIALH
jgi:hypothetical protein